MREIKFRAWDVTQGRLFNVLALQIDASGISDVFDGTAWLPIERVVLMQFTGLHDKNGKEIYEGDIVRNLWGTSERLGPIEITADKGVVTTHHDSLTGEKFGTPLWCDKELEVIGNIYENPELLK